MNKRNIDLSGLLKGKERQYGVKVILEIIVENFPNIQKHDYSNTRSSMTHKQKNLKTNPETH